MANFLERNKPIFLIGTLITFVFAGIIIYYVFKPHQITRLSRIEDTSSYNISTDEEILELEGGIVGSTEPAVSMEELVDEKYGTLEIEFTEEGFKPRIKKVYLGQNIRWTNLTDRIIYFNQQKKTYSALMDLKELQPGEGFEFRMTVLGIWAYTEKESGKYGSIEVLELPRDFLD